MNPNKLTRREFLNYAGRTSLGLGATAILAACGAPPPPTSTPIGSRNGVSPIVDNPIRATQLLPGSGTNEFLGPQYWYYPVDKGLKRTPQATPTPPSKNESISAAPPNAWYVPDNHFDTTVNVNGTNLRAGYHLQEGKYNYYPAVALQAIAITPDQLVRMEGSSNWVNTFEVTKEGLMFTGVLVRVGLIGALANFSISGGLQREIEGDRIITVRDANGNARFINVDEIKPQAQVNIAKVTDAKSLQGTFPKDFALEMGGNPFHPNDWKPPDKDPKKNCGVDLTVYFAYWLLSSTVSPLYRDEINALYKQNPSMTPEQFDKAMQEFEKRTPILRDIKKSEAEHNNAEKQLDKGGCNFHPEGGSVFMDFKLMRQRAWMKAGGYSNPNLSAEDYAQIWNKDPAAQSAHRKGVQTIDGMFNKDMTTEQAFQQAKNIIEKLWW